MFIVNRNIMDVVISDIFFNVDDGEFQLTCEWVLSILKFLKMQTTIKLSSIENKI